MSADLFQAFRQRVARQPGDLALIVADHGSRDGVRRYRWEELGRAVAKVADQIAAMTADVGPRKRVGYRSDNGLADVLISLAAMAIDAIDVPLDHRLRDEEIERRWNRVGGAWIDDADRASLVSSVRSSSDVGERIDDDSPRAGGNRMDADALNRFSGPTDLNRAAIILWTSGTSGQPLGVTLSAGNLCGNAAAKLAHVPQTSRDVRLCTLPLCHAYARTCDFGTWLLSGCTLALGLGWSGWQSLGSPVRPTLANVVPALADRLADAEPDSIGIDRLRLLGCGGAAMSADSFASWSERGVTVIQGYGLTETSPVICSATPENATAGCVGDFVDGWEHEVRDGRLHVRGPHVMLGYWDDPVATASRIDPQGWLDTGDLVQKDRASGQLRILGRADDMIVLSSGRKFHPKSIEQQLQQLAGIRHALLIPVDGAIELWLDADRVTVQTRHQVEVLFADRPHWQRPHRIARFEPPLSIAAGDLTTKGTARRGEIIRRRCLG